MSHCTRHALPVQASPLVRLALYRRPLQSDAQLRLTCHEPCRGQVPLIRWVTRNDEYVSAPTSDPQTGRLSQLYGLWLTATTLSMCLSDKNKSILQKFHKTEYGYRSYGILTNFKSSLIRETDIECTVTTIDTV